MGYGLHAIRGPRWLLALALSATAAAAILFAGMYGVPRASARVVSARAAGDAQQCAEPYPAQRDPSNPLDLPTAPGSNPLTGANFFVPGPAHGSAAGAIAQLLGLNAKKLPDAESWASFAQQLSLGPLASRVTATAGAAHEIAELSKIAAEPEAQRFSIYSEGGGPGKIFAQAEKIFCHNMTADPGSIPIINTYFMHPALGGCPT
ncbi:MAG: hypothetical protein WAK93_02010, partial [Solirubrobacteraceae bacterium]